MFELKGVDRLVAARFAEALEHNEKLFVRLALQDQVTKAGLKLAVSVGDAA